MPRMLLVAAALAVVLAGCGEDSPAAAPSPSSPPTSPVSTTPAPPELPAAARENTKAGAIAFVRHYVGLINYAQATGDVDVLTAVEDPGCQSCENGREYLQEVYGAGGHIEGGEWKLRRLTATQSGENWAVTATGAFDPSDAYPSPGAEPKHSEGGRVLTNFVVWHEGNWRVRTWFSG